MDWLYILKDDFNGEKKLLPKPNEEKDWDVEKLFE